MLRRWFASEAAWATSTHWLRGPSRPRPDGRRLFFPWGIWGRGYVIPTEQHYERLLRQIKTYTMVSLVVVIVAVGILKGLWALAAAAVLMIFYVVWIPILVRGLATSDEKLTMAESMTTQARTHNLGTLRLLLVVSLLFVTIGLATLLFDPSQWPLSLTVIVFFGLCAVVFVRMLMLRRRATDG
jgi:L-asparagine transporter-like permease